MKKPLIAFFVTVSISLVIVLCWAGSHQSLWDYLSHHGRNPWYIATILDCYWGFLIFYLWVIYKDCRCNLRNDQDPQAAGQRFI